MSNVPSRVKADAELADQQLAELARVAAPAPAADEPQLEPVPTLAEPPAPPAPTVVPVNLEAQLVAMQQKLSSLQGRLEAANTESAALRERLENQPPPAPQPAPTPAAPKPSAITDKEREEYGDEFLALVGKVVIETLGTRVDDMASRIAQLEGRIGHTSQKVEKVEKMTQAERLQKYENRLTELVPDWELINEEQGFLDWLQEVDKLTGKVYHQILNDAHNRGLADQVGYIFNLYKESKGTGTPAAPAPPAPTPAPTRIDPNSLVAPAASASPQPTSSGPTKPIWSAADVDKLYEDKQKGRIKPDEFARREAEYIRALSEGRVSAT